MEKKGKLGALIGTAVGVLIIGSGIMAIHGTTTVEPCLGFVTELAENLMQEEHTVTARMDKLRAAQDDALRKAELSREQAEALRQDDRWDDPEQVEHLEYAVTSSAELADDYESQAQEAANLVACLEET